MITCAELKRDGTSNLTVGTGAAGAAALAGNRGLRAAAVGPQLGKDTVLVVGELANALADVADKLVVLQTQRRQLLEFLQVLRDVALELIAEQVQLAEAAEVGTDAVGDLSVEEVGIEEEDLEVGQVADRGGDGTGDLVVR